MEVLQARMPVSDTTDVGHGLFRVSTPRNGKWLGHNGSTLGFTGTVLWKEEGDCVISVLANVGTMHCGSVPSDASQVVFRSCFLDLAVKLTELAEQKM